MEKKLEEKQKSRNEVEWKERQTDWKKVFKNISENRTIKNGCKALRHEKESEKAEMVGWSVKSFKRLSAWRKHSCFVKIIDWLVLR